jgi:tetratricopeptide (TPR) repeat protein
MKALPVKAALATLAMTCLAPQPLNAQHLQGVSDKEIVRRQENLLVGEKLSAAGDKAAAEKDYETAYTNYLDALDAIPGGAATKELRAKTVSKFSKIALLYAEKLIADGRYGDAERVAKTVLLPEYDPSNKAAVRLLSNLEQPDYYNKTVTPQFAASREEVTKLLYEADGFFQAGRFDLAIKRYEQVLNIDRYNIAARNRGITATPTTKRAAGYCGWLTNPGSVQFTAFKADVPPPPKPKPGEASVELRPPWRSSIASSSRESICATPLSEKPLSFSSSAAANSTPRRKIPRRNGA